MNKTDIGLRRLVKALIYSIQGLLAAWKIEASFRQEIIAAVILIPASFAISKSWTQAAVLLVVVALVLIAELVNSAIEALVDQIGEYNELSGRAKDMGSAAVLLSILLCLTVWILVICQNYFIK